MFTSIDPISLHDPCSHYRAWSIAGALMTASRIWSYFTVYCACTY